MKVEFALAAIKRKKTTKDVVTRDTIFRRALSLSLVLS